MAATRASIVIEQGADFDMVIGITGGPADLTGYTGAMQIRALATDTATLYDSGEGGLTVDPINWQVVVKIPCAETATFGWSLGVYDVLITSGDGETAYRLAEGKVNVDRSVTRED